LSTWPDVAHFMGAVCRVGFPNALPREVHVWLLNPDRRWFGCYSAGCWRRRRTGKYAV